MDLPTGYLTTVRGRGGLGSSAQKLCDIFWQLTTDNSSPTAVETLLHFYVTIKTPITDANMKVSYGYPINTFSAKNAASKSSGNDGRLALNTGMKLYVAPAAVPVANYYGFYALRMQPFFKSSGCNEIDVVVNSKRAVQCFVWGSENGQGWALLHNHAAITYFPAATKYAPLIKYAEMNMVICKIGTAAGTATTGDVIMIPSTQKAPDANGVNNPLPGHTAVTPVLPNSRDGIATAALNNQN
jgi:hypothetical protein